MTIKNADDEVTRNEVDDFIDSRYVSSIEAAWRLLELPMHANSHTVVRLPVHLPGKQQVTFQEGQETNAISSLNTVTQLMGFFQLNCNDTEAGQYKYIEIPKHYVWVQKDRKWKRRQRGGDKVVVRMYAVSPRDSERFFLRKLICLVMDSLYIDGEIIDTRCMCTTSALEINEFLLTIQWLFPTMLILF